MFDFCVVICRYNRSKEACHYHYSEMLSDRDTEINKVSGANFSAVTYKRAKSHENGVAKTEGITLMLVGRVLRRIELWAGHNTLGGDLSPTELLNLYLSYGPGFIDRVKGVFVMFIADERTNHFYAYVSKSGLLKLYYYCVNHRLIISTSLVGIVKNSPNNLGVDHLSLLELSMFGHTIGHRTHCQGVSGLDNCSYLCYDLDSIKLIPYYNLAEKVTSKGKVPYKHSLKIVKDVFNKVMDSAITKEPFNCSLTGGYDSRAILSYLLMRGDLRYQIYSWAANEKWPDMQIAHSICAALNIHHHKIMLDEEFVRSYLRCAAEIVYWSDGFGSIKRTNQMYAHRILSHYSDKLVTGYFGSELIRPLNPNNDLLDNYLARVILEGRVSIDELDRRYHFIMEKSCLTQNVVNDYFSEFVSEVKMLIEETNTIVDPGQRILYYLLKYGFWKFFGQEFHAQRVNTIMISPYIDDDFIMFLLSSHITDVHHSTYTRNPFHILRGQNFYHPIIEGNSPILMTFPTNRGFSPRDFKSPLFPLNVVVKHAHEKRRQRRSKIEGFTSYLWNDEVYKVKRDVLLYNDELFEKLGGEKLTDGRGFSIKQYILGMGDESSYCIQR